MVKKVLHLIDSSGFYGAERVVVTLCSKMPNNFFHPMLGCLMAKDAEFPEVGTVARKLGTTVIPIELANKFDWRSIKKVIHSYDIDIIHCHGYKPSLLAYFAERFSGERIIITCHLWTNETLRLKVYSFVESLIMRKANRVVAVSDAIKHDIVKMGVKESKIEIIFNGIDLQKWQPAVDFDSCDFKMQLGLKGDSVILGLFGRLSHQKGHEYLFQALSRIKTQKIELICVGDGYLKPELLQKAERLGISDKVHFLGFRKDVKKLLQITDIFVMPSLDEGLPMALLEAMAVGKAVVATPVGAIPTVINDGHDGILVSPQSVAELTRVIVQLLSDKSKMKILGRNAQDKVMQKFSSEAMAASYLDVYQKAIRNKI